MGGETTRMIKVSDVSQDRVINSAGQSAFHRIDRMDGLMAMTIKWQRR